jgi:Ser-tRNA(Ala) deacylase AlaX
MTEKLFMNNPYLKEFEAAVIDVKNNYVILDKTCFFPESGGQSGDTGYLNQIKVTDTKYDEKRENILHIVEKQPDFKIGDKLIGKIDWDRRYDTMKLHAASHIMEYFLFKTFGELKLRGTHVNEKHDSSTYQRSEPLDADKLKAVETSVNEFISKGYEIERWENANKPGWWYWKAGEIEIPCGGTHPKNIKEIGTVSISRKGSGKEKETVITSLVH